jgi:hypothetical protein
MATTLKNIQKIKKRTLIYLVEYFFEYGFTSEKLSNKQTSGIYEYRIAFILGYDYFSNRPLKEFVLAVDFLEEDGLITRKINHPRFPNKVFGLQERV